MKKIQKIKITLTLIFLLVAFLMLNAQIKTVNGFNYYDINKSAFINANCPSMDADELEERQYFYTSFLLAETLDSIFRNTNGAGNVENEFGNYLRQGNAHRIQMVQLNATYQFWHNMYGVLKFGTRILDSDIDTEDYTSTWFSLGVRINASNRRWDY